MKIVIEEVANIDEDDWLCMASINPYDLLVTREDFNLKTAEALLHFKHNGKTYRIHPSRKALANNTEFMQKVWWPLLDNNRTDSWTFDWYSIFTLAAL